jgi:hypothetical protein
MKNILLDFLERYSLSSCRSLLSREELSVVSVQAGYDASVSYGKVMMAIRAPPDFFGIKQEAFDHYAE